MMFNTYNNWHAGEENPTTFEALTAMLAKRDRVCRPESSWTHAAPASPAAIKALNPATKTYVVYDLNIKNAWDSDVLEDHPDEHWQTPLSYAEIAENDWWLVDADGNPVKSGNGSWILDVGRPGFKERFAEVAISRLTTFGVDGVVFDYWWPFLLDFVAGMRAETGESYPLPLGQLDQQYATDEDWRTNAWYPFIDYVTAAIAAAGFEVVGNCAGEYGSGQTWYDHQRSLVHASIYEQWAVGWPQEGSAWLPIRKIDERIAAFNQDTLPEAWVAEYGLNLEYPVTDFDQKRRMSYAMFLIAQSKTRPSSYNYYNNSYAFWDTDWDLPIGTPVTDAPTRHAAGLWSREYTGGCVVMNYCPVRRTAVLPQAYAPYGGGRPVRMVMLPPFSVVYLQLPE